MKTIYLLILFLITHTLANAQWVITSGPSEPLISSLAANDNVLIAGCSSASSNYGGHRTLNEGTSWTPTGTSLISKFNSLAINPNSGTVYAGGFSCFYQSFDNGATFTLSNNGMLSGNTRDILVDGTNIYAANSGIYLSTNGGFNWSLISPAMAATKLDKSGNIILVGTSNAGVYLSIDNGSTWTNPNSGLLANTIQDVKISGTNLLAATASGVYISTNSGTTWSLSNLSLSTWCFYNVGTTLFAGTDPGGVYYSNDGGNTWIAANTGLTNMSVYSFASNSNYLFAGTNAYVFRRPLIDFGMITSNKINTSNGIEISPNPSTGIITLTKINTYKSEIEVFNQIGEKVYTTITNAENTKIDLSNLAKGIYFLRMTESNKDIFTKKIVLN
jgi:photosystem II stability/assembly factor-like uncharacterized protein